MRLFRYQCNPSSVFNHTVSQLVKPSWTVAIRNIHSFALLLFKPFSRFLFTNISIDFMLNIQRSFHGHVWLVSPGFRFQFQLNYVTDSNRE